MGTSWIRAAALRLPPIAWRDDALARQRTKLRLLQAELDRTKAGLERRESEHQAEAEGLRDAFARRPSFQVRIHMERRLRRLGEELGAPSTSVIRHGKFQVYDLVRSHGIAVPTGFGQWEDPHDIDWAALPEQLVLKSAFGSAAKGVWPLRRTAGGWRQVGDDTAVSNEELVSTLSSLIDQGRIRPPFRAEEFLDEDGTGRLPTDVKVYAFYGEAPMVVLRRPRRLGEHPRDTRFRAIDEDGSDIAGLETRSTIETTLPVPPRFGEAVEQAKRLSLVLRTPFSRLDFYCLPDRVVFGEVTPRPGGSAWHGPAVDQRLGDAWDRAQVRIARDVADGLPPEPQLGDQ